MANAAYQSKRQSERYRVSLAVMFRAPDDGSFVIGRSRDISLGGMFVETDRPLPYGTRTLLEVQLPALQQAAQIEATVRWVGPDGMGVQWGALQATVTWAINQLLRG